MTAISNPNWKYIDGKLCSFHQITRPWKSPYHRRSYAGIRITIAALKETDFTVVAIQISGYDPTTFVIPNAILVKAYFPSGRKQAFLAFPLKRLPEYCRRRPKIDHWQYKDAWHLLNPKPLAS